MRWRLNHLIKYSKLVKKLAEIDKIGSTLVDNIMFNLSRIAI